MKKLRKKSLALVLSVSVLFSCMCTAGFTASAEDDNIIGQEVVKNGTMDDAFNNGWTNYSGASNVNAPDNIQAEKTPCLSFASYSGMVSTQFTLQSDYIYQISFDWAPQRTEDGGALFVQVTDDFDPNNVLELYKRTFTSGNNYAFHTFTDTFVTDENAEGRTFHLYFINFEDEKETYLDNVSVKAIKKDTVILTNNLIADPECNNLAASDTPSFEGWSTWYNPVVIKNDYTGKTGDNVIYFPDKYDGQPADIWGDGVYTKVKLKAEQEYTLSFDLAPVYSKPSTGGMNVEVYPASLFVRDQAPEESQYIVSTTVYDQDYLNFSPKRKYVKFTSNFTGDVVVRFGFHNKRFTQALDNITLTPTMYVSKNLVPDPECNSLVASETPSATGWNYWYLGPVLESNYNEKVGDNILYFPEKIGETNNQYGTGVYTLVELEAGKKYNLVFDYAPCFSSEQDGGMLAEVFPLSKWNLWEAPSAPYLSQTVYGNVQYFLDTPKSLTFTATETGIAVLRFGFNLVKSWQGIDNINIYEVDETYHDYVLNGSFEDENVVKAKYLEEFANSDYYGWCLKDSADLTTEHASIGAKALVATGASAGAVGRVFAPISNPILGFNYFGEEGATATVKLSTDFAGNNVISTINVTGNGTEQKIFANTTLAANKELFINIDSTDGNNYFDGVSLITYDYSISEDFEMDENYFYAEYGISTESFSSIIECKNATLNIQDNIIATGKKLSVSVDNRFNVWSRDLVVKGDINGDGIISIIDLVKIKKHLAEVQTLSGAYLHAALIANDEVVAVDDMVALRQILLGLFI